jgi:hypothetical protein
LVPLASPVTPVSTAPLTAMNFYPRSSELPSTPTRQQLLMFKLAPFLCHLTDQRNRVPSVLLHSLHEALPHRPPIHAVKQHSLTLNESKESHSSFEGFNSFFLLHKTLPRRLLNQHLLSLNGCYRSEDSRSSVSSSSSSLLLPETLPRRLLNKHLLSPNRSEESCSSVTFSSPSFLLHGTMPHLLS